MTRLADIGTQLLLALALVAIYYVGLILHELGHLVGAWAVGWKATRLSIGTGTTLATWRIGELKVTFGASFTSGSVIGLAKERAHFRLKSFLIAAAGPVVTVFYIALLFALLDHLSLPHARSNGQTTLTMALLLEAWILMLCVWPREIRLDGVRVPNDGLLMWQALFSRQRALEHMLARHLMARAQWLVGEGRVPEAMAVAQEAAAAAGQSLLEMRLDMIRYLAEEGHAEEAFAEWDRLEQMERFGEHDQNALRDVLACLPLQGAPALLPKALETIERALLQTPTPTLRGTKGSLLIESGRIEAGERLLREVQAESQAPIDQSYSAWYLALAAAKKGERTEAEQLLQKAQAEFPKAPVRERIEALVRTAAAVPTNQSKPNECSEAKQDC